MALSMPYAWVNRRRPPNTETQVEVNIRQRPLVNSASPSIAPDPVRYGDYFAIGKSPQHAYSHFEAAWSWAGDQYRAVMADNFLIYREAEKHVTGVPPGLQAPQGTRINIGRGDPGAYGSLVTLVSTGSGTVYPWQ